jgi:glycosidase
MTEPLRILEISIPHASVSGRFCDALQLSEQIARDGFNTVFVLPWMKVNRALSSSPYAVVNHMEVNEMLGTLNDARVWIAACHDAGLRVILDLPLNHTSPDHSWTANKNWYSKTEDGEMHPPLGTNWKDVVQLNHSCEQVKLACIEVMIFWLNIGVDGFRLDAASFMPPGFVGDILYKMHRLKKHVVFWGDGENSSGVSSFYDAWFYHEAFALGKQNPRAWTNLIESHGNRGIFYLTNHDTLYSGLSPVAEWGDVYHELRRNLWLSNRNVMQSWSEWTNPHRTYSFHLK